LVANKETLLRLYRALVRSKLDYGCLVYGAARKSYIKNLDPIHHQGLRICLGAFRTTPVQSLYAEAGEPPLSLRRRRLAMNYVLKLRSNPANPCYKCVFKPKFLDKYRNKPNEIPPLGIRVLTDLEQCGINVENVSDDPMCFDFPPWTLTSPSINLNLTVFRKDSVDPVVLKQRFLEEIEGYDGYDQIYTDGSKKEERVAAAVVSKVGKNYEKHKIRINDFSSIYTAELVAIYMALTRARKSRSRSFLILSDSLSSLQALANRNRVNCYVEKVLDFHAKVIAEGKSVVFMWVPSHIGIVGNEMADEAAKAALDIPHGQNMKIPFSDFKCRTIQWVGQEWKIKWDEEVGNKLFEIKPDLFEKLPSVVLNRKEETLLSRIRLGHTHVTHGFILRREERPWCIGCDQPFTVRHVFFECWDLFHVRMRFFGLKDMKGIFRMEPRVLFDFLKEVNFYVRF